MRDPLPFVTFKLFMIQRTLLAITNGFRTHVCFDIPYFTTDVGTNKKATIFLLVVRKMKL